MGDANPWYGVFANMNAVTNSPTMISRRALSLQRAKRRSKATLARRWAQGARGCGHGGVVTDRGQQGMRGRTRILRVDGSPEWIAEGQTYEDRGKSLRTKPGP